MAHMTDEQKYSAVLKELGEVLQSKNTTISCQSWQIDQLKGKLEAAEKEAQEKKATFDFIIRSFYDLNAAILECVNIETGGIINMERLRELQDDIKLTVRLTAEKGGAA